MKFFQATIARAMALLPLAVLHRPLCGVNGQATVLDASKFAVVRSYSSLHIPVPLGVDEDDYGEYLGGGFIDGDNLYVVAGAERVNSTFVKVALTRDGKAHQRKRNKLVLSPACTNLRLLCASNFSRRILPSFWDCSCHWEDLGNGLQQLRGGFP